MCGIDLTQELEGGRLVVDLRDDLSPRFGRQHVSEVVVDTDRLDPHHARGVTGFELQQLTSLQALDVVVPDTNLQGLATRHDRVEIRTLDAHLTHGCSFLVEVQSPLLHDAVRCVSAREHTFERPAVTLEAGDLPRLGNEVNIQLVTVVRQQSLKVDDKRFERCLRRRHERHQLDGLTLLGCSASDADHLTAALGSEDDLVLGIHVAKFLPLVASEQGVNPVVVHATENIAHLRQDELSRAFGVLLLIEGDHRDIG